MLAAGGGRWGRASAKVKSRRNMRSRREQGQGEEGKKMEARKAFSVRWVHSLQGVGWPLGPKQEVGARCRTALRQGTRNMAQEAQEAWEAVPGPHRSDSAPL